MEGDTKALALGQLTAPAGFLGHQLQHAAHTLCIVAVAARSSHHGLVAQEFQPKRHRVCIGRMGQFVDERLDDERKSIGPRRPQGARGHAGGNE